MKVAILNLWSISENAMGGTERFVDDLSISLSKAGNMVDVYMFSGNSFKKDNINFISLDIFGVGTIADEYMIQKKFGDFNTISSYDELAKLLEKKIDVQKYDFIHLNSHLFIKCFQNKNRIITMHSNYEEFKILWSDKSYKLMIDILKSEIKDNNLKVVCPSKYYSREWKKILNEKVYCIYHALNIDRLKCNIKKDELINKYKLSKSKIKILLPSRLEPIQKRPKLILEGIKNLDIKDCNKFQIIFTGIDTQYKKYVKELNEYSKKNNIDSKFITFDHISQGYKLCDIVCVPSKSESFGYSALESISLGIKTILSDIPTYNELKGHNKNVYIFKDTNNLTSILKNILNNKNYERSKVSNLWLNQFDLNKFGNKYIKIL